MKRIFKIILILLLFIFIFWLLNKLLTPKYIEDLVEGSMISEYYDSEKDHDVIFIGDCETYANISPLVMYQEAGIKSYVRGSSQQMLWQSYYILKETLKYEKPKIVIFNVGALRNGEEKINEAYNRLAIDKMKWSKEKVEIIIASMNEDESFISYLFPILRYHSRYDKLKSEDLKYLFKSKKVLYNGFLVNKNVKAVENLPAKKKLGSYDFPEENLKYLNMIVELCKDNNIKLILMKAPSFYPYWYEEYDEFLNDYSKENNLDYYNFINLIDEIGLDFSNDTYDGGLHLNLYGATKLSRYFSQILSDKYNIPNYSGDEKYDELLKKYLNEIK